MRHELQTIFNITKDNTVRSRQLGLKLGFLLVVAFLTLGLFHDSALAASGLRIYNYTTKKESTYTDKQIKVTLNGETVTKSHTPGILVSGIAMVPYNDVFEKSEIAAECNYDKEKGTISISKYGKTLQMTIGSKKAKLNGKTVNLSVAPIKVKFMKDGLVKVLVPSRFISETLGLKYTWNSSKSTVAIEMTTLMLSYNGAKKFEYTGALGKVTVDGKNINLGKMPSIITNNTAMLRAKWVFTNPAIGATYQYDNAKKKLTLTKGNTVLVMTVGDTTAYLNGNATKMDTAPMIIKNYSSGTSYLMVPGSFTASCLGFNYKWDNATRTSIIATQKSTTPGNTGSGNSPELGDSSVIIEAGTILNQWVADTSVYSLSTELHEISVDSVEANPAALVSVTRDNSIIKQNAETFKITANGSMGKITSQKADKQIQIQVANLSATDITYPMYGIFSNYVNTIGTYTNSSGQTTLLLDLLSSEYTYDVALSQDKQTLYITVYHNTLTSAVIGTNNAGDYVTLTGIKPLKVTMNQSTGYLNIDLPYTTNGIGDIYTNLVGSKYINLFYSIATPDSTQIVIGANEGYEYYISETDNKYSILFLTPGSVQQPPAVTPTQPGLSDQVDPNECEIIIPRPDGLNAAMITDEDYYFENSFVLRLMGDYTGVINSSNIINTSGRVKDISVNLNSNNETEIRIRTSKLQGYEYTMDDKNIYINIGDPKDIYPNIVILDPGHGGGAIGAQYYGTNEKDLNFKILYTLGKKYFNQDTSKLKVYYTRIKDVDMSLSDRAAFASKYGADLFVSLHMNANLNRTVYGTEVYYSTNNNSPNKAGLTSKALADLFGDRISGNLGTKNRGSRAERYTVVHKNTVPAVLIELGFMSTESDFNKLSDPTFQDNAARTIYETLLEVFSIYPTGR